MTGEDYDSLIPPGFDMPFTKTMSTNTDQTMHSQGQGERYGSTVQFSGSLRKQRSTRARGRPRKQRLDAPPTTRTPAPAVPVPPPVPPPGSSINAPVLIADEEQSDKKMKLNPLSELSRPPNPRLRNQCSAPHIHQQSKMVVANVKSVLVFQLTSGSTKNIEAMVKCANNAFSNLDLLEDDYTSFYNDVKSFIEYHYHFLTAERQRDMQSFPELKTRYEDALAREKVEENEVFVTRGHEEMFLKKREALERQMVEAIELIGKLKQLIAVNEHDAEAVRLKKQRCMAAHENAKQEVQKIHTKVEAAKDVLREIERRKIVAFNGIESTTRRLKSLQS